MSTPERYSIGALARLAGVPVETVRTWERRYGVPEPAPRDDGPRAYDVEEVERVRHIAALARLGERVRDLAPLDAPTLEARLATHRAARKDAPLPTVLRVAVVAPAGPDHLAGVSPSGLTRLDLVARAPTADALPDLDEVDVLVVLHDDPALDLLATLDLAAARVHPRTVLVRAAFVSGPVRRGLVARDVRVVSDRRPAELRRAVEDAAVVARIEAGERPVAPVPAPRLSPEMLERLLATPSTVACECLNHLAAIVTTLGAFETYARGCVTNGGPDAELHGALAQGSSAARAQMEDLLLRVARHEGIQV